MSSIPVDPRQQYEVFVGHTSVTVEGGSVAEAIAIARRLLCARLPRLWDVIDNLESDRFQVRRIAPDRRSSDT